MNVQSSYYEYSKVQSYQASITKNQNGEISAEVNYQSLEKTLYVEDQLTLNNETQQEKAPTYAFDAKTVAAMKKEISDKSDSFKSMVRDMLEKQGLNVEDILSRLSKGEEVIVEIDAETKAKAQEAISEDGYWGVEKTAGRILDFAKAISNNDSSKIEQLKEAFIDGFNQIKELFGDELPDISKQTYDRVMKGFDEWANGTEDSDIEAAESTETSEGEI